MKVSKRQLKRIIREEKAKLVKEQGYPGGASPGDAIQAAEQLLIGIALEMIARNDGSMEEQIYAEMMNTGYEDFDTQAALDQLMDRHGTSGGGDFG